MPKFHRDNVSRIEDIEGLLSTARDLLSRLSEAELHNAKQSVRSALQELRTAKQQLVIKWKQQRDP